MDGRNDSIRRELETCLESQPVFDTHEHLPPFGNQWDARRDILAEYLLHYISNDLQAAGMTDAQLERVQDPDVPLTERWDELEPWWERTRDTAYARALTTATEKLYGIGEWTRGTIVPLNERFRAAMEDPGHRMRVLRGLCNIRVSLLDFWQDGMGCDREFYRPVWQPNRFVMPGAGASLPATLDAHLEEAEEMYRRNLRDGMAALKCALAYDRPIRFEAVPADEARAGYAAAAREGFAHGLPRPVQDHVFHYMLGLAERDGLPVQIHTGLQEGNRHHLPDSDPMLLEPLFGRYPGIPFDLFHIGYPWFRESLVLAKTHPNVHLDMCWSHMIAPSAARIALREFLEAVPVSKIFAFGGDYQLVDGVLGHLTLARENVTAVLAGMVADHAMDFSRACRVLAMLFHDNAARVFGV
ncbi:MAG: amidohydrolase family protein [Clostridia bacterium]|nr:amidohydrolase family protein [Clostridia bacterium]